MSDLDMESRKNSVEMLKRIEEKLGFNIREQARMEQETLVEMKRKMEETGKCDSHEDDNTPNTYDKLTMCELLFVREYTSS